MKQKKSACVYPFSENTVGLLRFLEKMNSSIEIKAVASEGGLCPAGFDVSKVDNRGSEFGIRAAEYSADLLDQCEVLLVPYVEAPDAVLYEKVKSVILEALSRRKEVLCAMKIAGDDLEKIQSFGNCHDAGFTYLGTASDYLDEENQMVELPYYMPNAVIIFSGTICIRDHVCESALSIVHGLRQKGHKVSGILQSGEGELLGIHGMPSSLDYSDGISPRWIKRFNNFIRAIDETEKPDAIVIELPGTLLPYDEFIVGDYGLTAFAITQAAAPDFIHVCVPYSNYSPELIEKLSSLCQSRYSHGIDSIHVSNVIKSDMETSSMGRFSHTHVNANYVDEKLAQFQETAAIPIFNITKDSGMDLLCEHILKVLS